MTLKIKKKKDYNKMVLACWGKSKDITSLFYLSLCLLQKKTHSPKLGIFFYMKFKRVPGWKQWLTFAELLSDY